MTRLFLAVAAIALLVVPATVVRAQEDPTASDWQLTTLGEPIAELWVSANGGLFARIETGLISSYDDGESWRMLPPPPADGGTIVAVDPANDATLYGRGADGLYKTTDAGAAWSRVLATHASFRLAVSRADSQLLFLAQIHDATALEVLRSMDGGATWRVLEQRRASLCGFRVLLLEAHATDPSTVFRVADCFSGRSSSGPLELSRDAGEHWSSVVRPFLKFADRLVGGAGTDGGRFYLAADGGLSIGSARGGSVFRSDDGGQSWTEILTVPADPSTVDIVRIGGLVYDASAPDLVFAGRAGGEGGVLASCDGGTSWTSAGVQDIGSINDLAIRGGAYLYAATEQGLWRLPLHVAADVVMPCAMENGA
jgi:photosystem II stability/assembly factor-like uncharacterized protein